MLNLKYSALMGSIAKSRHADDRRPRPTDARRRAAAGALALLGVVAALILSTPRAHAAEPEIAAARHMAGPLPSGWHAVNPLHYIAHASVNSPDTGNASPPYTPQQMRQAYGVGDLDLPNTTGAGITVAIVDAYGDQAGNGTDTIQSDLKSFSSYYGLPYTASGSGATLVEAFPDGSPGRNSSWADETCLDVEWVHAMAPGATILLVVATNASQSLYDCVAYAGAHANIVSMSWGGSEFDGENTYDSAYFAASGVCYFASTGDDGSGAAYPAASPNVTAAGGTTLTVDTSGNWVSETGWSGSGGGPSAYEPLPSYQDDWISSGTREIPDVSTDADPDTGVLIYLNGSQSALWGGTSLASPLWAGVTALIDANLSSPLSESALHAALYEYGSPANIDTYFHDIVSGSNGGFDCEVGYDEVTGIGTPIGYALAGAIAPQTPTITSFNPTSGAVGASVTITGTNLSGATNVAFGSVAATYTVNSATQITATVPTGARTGDISVTTPAGTATSQTTFSVTTPAVSSLSLSASSGFGGVQATATVTLTADAPSGGAQVTLTSANTPVISLPATTTVPGGAKTVQFTFTPAAVTTATPVQITASYGGQNESQTYTVNPPASTTTSLNSSANPAVSGTSVTFTATVNGSSPTGTVNFTIDSDPQSPVSVSDGSAMLSLSSLSMGSHTVSASYSGDTGNQASTSSQITQTIVGTPTATAQSVSTLVNTALPITLSGTDPDTPPLSLTYAIAAQPSHGLLSGTVPNLTYTPTSGYTGSDSFTFTATNGYAASAAAAVSITVNALPVTAAPALSPGSGSYSNLVSVGITDATSGAAIYYTTDGSTPSVVGGVPQGATQTYSAPFNLTSTTTVNAFASAPGCTSSAVTSATYTVTYQRIVASQTETGTPGSTVVVPITVNASGAENTIGGTLTFDPTVLTYVSAALGTDMSGGSLALNATGAASGSLGFGAALTPDTTLPAGTRQILTVTFTISASTTAAQTPIAWSSTPVPEQVVDQNANDLPATFTGSTVWTGVEYEGDILNHGTVDLADWVEVGRIAIGIDPQPPAGLEYQEADCSPRGDPSDGPIGLADWVQVGRYAIGLDPLTPVGGPTAPAGN